MWTQKWPVPNAETEGSRLARIEMKDDNNISPEVYSSLRVNKAGESKRNYIARTQVLQRLLLFPFPPLQVLLGGRRCQWPGGKRTQR